MGYANRTRQDKHLQFEKLPLEKGRKLHKYKIINTDFNEEIGIIHWRGGWIQYVSQTHSGVDMTRSCNREVNDFIDNLMKDWRNSKKKQS